MKALIIGGTGVISSYVVKLLVEKNWEVWVINRGLKENRHIEGINNLVVDINDTDKVKSLIENLSFDTVSDFVAFKKEDVVRDYNLFKDKTRQYIFTSSASCYLKPCSSPFITEGTTLANKYWQYSRNKIECEDYLREKNRENDFTFTIVRPSHTYSEYSIPFGLHGDFGSWQIIKRMMEGKRVIVPGDGTSLWTLTHSKDFAIGYVGLMGNTHAYNEAFNITGSEVLTWNQIYQTIADSLGVEFKPYYVSSSFLAETGKKYGYDFEGALLGDKANSVIFDNKKLLNAVPEMKTTVLFHDGVRASIKYYMDHKEYQREDKKFDEYCDKVIEAQEDAKNRV